MVDLDLRGGVGEKPVSIFSVDGDGVFTYVSPVSREVFGYGPKEVEGMPFDAFVHPEDLPGLRHSFERPMTGEPEPWEFRVFHKCGRIVHVRSSPAPILVAGRIVGLQGVVTDITERNRAEELAQVRLRLLQFAESHTLAELLQRTLDEIGTLAGTPIGFYHFIEADQKTLSLQAWSIAERKRTEEALRRADQQQRALLDSIPDLAWLKDADGRFIAANAPLGRACGIPPHELRGKTDLDIWPLELAQRYRADDCLVIESGRPARVEEPLEDSITGNRSWIETIRVPIADGSGNVVGTAGIARDITERRRVQEALRKRTAQLEALREVSLGITAQLDLDRLLRTISEQAMTLFGADAGELFLYRSELKLLERIVSVGVSKSKVKETVRLGEGFAGEVWESGKPLVVNWPAQSSEIANGLPQGSALGAPIRWRDELLGVLGVLSLEAGVFRQPDAELLELFATQAAVAIVNARLFEEVEHLAMVDELTALFNRRGLLELGRREVEVISLTSDSGPVGVTVSIGVAELGGGGEDLAALIREADEAMYAAKQAGRNCVVLQRD